MPKRQALNALLLTRDPNWYWVIVEALDGIAQVTALNKASQVEKLLRARQRGRRAVLIDTTAVRNLQEQVAYVRKWKNRAPIAVSAIDPEWRDAVVLLQAGAVDYIAKTRNVGQLRERLVKLFGPFPS